METNMAKTLTPMHPGEVLSTEEAAELWCISCTTQYPHLAEE